MLSQFQKSRAHHAWHQKDEHLPSSFFPPVLLSYDIICNRIPLWSFGVSCHGWVSTQLLVHPQLTCWCDSLRNGEDLARAGVSTVQQQLKFWCVFNTVRSTNPEHSNIPASMTITSSILDLVNPLSQIIVRKVNCSIYRAGLIIKVCSHWPDGDKQTP